MWKLGWQATKWTILKGEQKPTFTFCDTEEPNLNDFYYWKCFSDAILSLERQPLAGLVSPSLMGSHGVVPLTIISTLPDINRHTANCIVRARKEVFLATNFWIYSDASLIITNALRELSKRAGKRGDRVVVKIIYDRGSMKQVNSITRRLRNKGLCPDIETVMWQPPACAAERVDGTESQSARAWRHTEHRYGSHELSSPNAWNFSCKTLCYRSTDWFASK